MRGTPKPGCLSVTFTHVTSVVVAQWWPHAAEHSCHDVGREPRG